MWDAGLDEDAYKQVPRLAGTSHAVIVTRNNVTAARKRVRLRFFTNNEELPACGHGTIAALAFLALLSPRPDCRATIQTQARAFAGWARESTAGTVVAEFDPGQVGVRPANQAESELASSALRSQDDAAFSGVSVATIGRPRLLVPMASVEALWQLAPDLTLLKEACDRRGLLGCYCYTAPSPSGNVAARMFAPAIDVPEDIANANSAACLVALLAQGGTMHLSVDMGDAQGSPATVLASVGGQRFRIGGQASVSGHLELPLDAFRPPTRTPRLIA
jgi:trans-2,3-dihydro-3-hydroxyanthranilate isomerase